MTAEPTDDGRACPDCGTRNRPGAAYCADCATTLTAKLSPWNQRTRRRAIRLSTIVVVVVGLWLGFVAVQDTWYSAADPVKAYFAGLEERDGYQPPTDVVVGETVQGRTGWDGTCKRSTCYPDGDRATVRVSYTLAEKRYSGGVTVTRPADGWFRDWRVAEPRGLLRITSKSGHLTHVQVAGRTVATQREHFENNFASLPPGVYTVSVDNPLLEAPPQQVRVPISGGSDAWRVPKTEAAMPTPTIKSSAEETVRQLVRQKVQRCVAVTGDTPDIDPTDPGCGLAPKTLLVDDDTVRWTLDRHPKVKLRLTTNPHWGDPPVEVVTTTPGRATMHYQRIRSDKTKTEDVSFELDGGVAVKKHQVAWPADLTPVSYACPTSARIGAKNPPPRHGSPETRASRGGQPQQGTRGRGAIG